MDNACCCTTYRSTVCHDVDNRLELVYLAGVDCMAGSYNNIVPNMPANRQRRYDRISVGAQIGRV